MFIWNQSLRKFKFYRINNRKTTNGEALAISTLPHELFLHVFLLSFDYCRHVVSVNNQEESRKSVVLMVVTITCMDDVYAIINQIMSIRRRVTLYMSIEMMKGISYSLLSILVHEVSSIIVLFMEFQKIQWKNEERVLSVMESLRSNIPTMNYTREKYTTTNEKVMESISSIMVLCTFFST